MTGLAIAATTVGLAGCGQMASALGQQWVVVQFRPNTSLATARQVIGTCSHLPGLSAEPVKPTSADLAAIDSARIKATGASSADLARLEICLQRFRQVQGISLQEPGAG